MSRVVGILTGGGDCPGLNAVIRAVTVRSIERHGAEVVGFRNGWEGLMRGSGRPLDRDSVRGILPLGGTILGTSRMDPYIHGEGLETCRPALSRNGIDTLVVVGGDGTLRSANRLAGEGLDVVAVPKTIDNDIPGTDTTFGFSTATQVATDAIDRLTSTAEAHNRLMVVEVMGRTKGWIAAHAGIASGADAVLIPEQPYDLETVAATVHTRHRRGRSYSIVVVAEGVEPPEGARIQERTDAYGFARLGGVAYPIAERLEEMTGFESRVTVLGHIQRGGTPTAFDRVLATRLGVAAADYAAAGRRDVMTSLRGTEVIPTPLVEATRGVRGVDDDLYDTAATFFG